MQSMVSESAGPKLAGLEAIPDPRLGKYLIFQLGKEEFGTGVLRIREIMKIQEITAVPQTNPFIKGVINLRGKIIPVIDLRMKFGLPEQEPTERTCIIVVCAESGHGELHMGVVVDGVVEVLTLGAEDIEDSPNFGHGANPPYLLGMAKLKGRVKILLDMDEVLSRQDLQGLDALLQ